MGEEELGNIDFGIIESEASEVTADGTIVTEHVAAIVDEETGEAVVDTIVGVTLPDGTQIIEETLSVIDADGNISIEE